MKPNKKEITENIKWLKSNRENVPRRSFFGEDNWRKIDAEIEVLETDMEEDDIYAKSWGEDEEEDDSKDWNPHQRDSALNARRWLDGDEEESPMKSWGTLIKK